jgi:Cell wall-active antibiotics response 4TMS YvqF
VTRSDLERVTQDLPAEPSAAPAREAAPAPTRASTVFADVRRAGAWTVPAAGKWESLFGDVVLDVREARVMGPEVHINAGTIFGDVELLVPEGVEVEIRSRTLFGDIKQEAGETAPAGAPRIVLTGGTVFGDVLVRAHRLRKRLAERLDERLRLRRPD